MTFAFPLKLSVLMITYNQENFVAKALEHALNQETNLAYEIVVSDDSSTDGTPEIIRHYQAKYPHRIRSLLQQTNQGLARNFVAAHQACLGEYLAILEGDDYWLHPKKLQRQVDFLDGHPECSGCFHDVRLLHKDGTETPRCCRPDQVLFSNLDDFLMENCIPNCSAVMFRNRQGFVFPDWFLNLKYYDWPLHILNAQFGKIGYLDEALSVYRIHDGGAWHGATGAQRIPKVINIFNQVNEHLEFKYDPIIRLQIRYWEHLALAEDQAQTLEQHKRQNEDQGRLLQQQEHLILDQARRLEMQAIQIEDQARRLQQQDGLIEDQVRRIACSEGKIAELLRTREELFQAHQELAQGQREFLNSRAVCLALRAASVKRSLQNLAGLRKTA